MCGRWGSVPADRRAVVDRGHLVICGDCSLLCTPVVAAGGVTQLAVGKQGGVYGEGSEGEWRQSRVVSRGVEK